MTSRKITAAGVGAAAALIFASSAFAQAQPARPPAAAAPAAAAAPPRTQVTHGAALPGICVMSRNEVMATSEVGKYVNTRIQQIITQVTSELNAERTALETEAKNFQAQRGTLAQDALEKRAADLQIRENALQRKLNQRQREVEATQQKAVQRVLQEMDPIGAAAYQQRACSILLDRDSAVMVSNPAMDITASVTAGLNAKIKQFAFDRERLDTPPAATPAAPARQ